MLALWLFPQLVLVGIGEAFHFPGQVGLYYHEFPVSLRNTAAAMASLTFAIAFYLSSALIDLIRRVTRWLPDDINKRRLDNVYWLLFVVGALNFGYFLVCANLYKYQNNAHKERDTSNSGSDILNPSPSPNHHFHIPHSNWPPPLLQVAEADSPFASPHQRIGLGHVLNILSMVVSALVESERPKAFHFPGQVFLYYQEFPVSFKNTATAMVSMVIGIAFYLSTALINIVRGITG
ncbi:hypothetical protein L484_011202 [Morus notabilis]|uniref:Uncharacterized protein n=1 Tax=Morus notabilis TaxID=981085 RepID=W9SKV0_9ROSA|nr:hypothetical protein L484_011202 [Morus notabilis]